MFSVGFARGKLLLQRKWLKTFLNEVSWSFYFSFQTQEGTFDQKMSLQLGVAIFAAVLGMFQVKMSSFGEVFLSSYLANPESIWRHDTQQNDLHRKHRWVSVRWMSLCWLLSVHVMNFNLLSIGIQNFIVLSGCMLYFVVLSVVAANVIMLIVAVPILRSCSWIQWGEMSCQFLPPGGSMGLRYVLEL